VRLADAAAERVSWITRPCQFLTEDKRLPVWKLSRTVVMMKNPVGHDDSEEPVRHLLCRKFKPPLPGRVFVILSILGPGLLFSACASVDTILLTSNTFPPKESVDEVAVLDQEPARPHLHIAELRIGDDWLSFSSLQQKVLSRAAALGADAVVFDKPQTATVQDVTYEPLYGPWGYNSPYYGTPWGYGSYGGLSGGWGMWGGGYSNIVAVPYEETVRMLMGTAIRYTDGATSQDFRNFGR
jgi:hypothetical protein